MVRIPLGLKRGSFVGMDGREMRQIVRALFIRFDRAPKEPIRQTGFDIKVRLRRDWRRRG